MNLATLTFCMFATGSFAKFAYLERPTVTARKIGFGRLLLQSRYPIMDVHEKGGGFSCFLLEVSDDRRKAVVQIRGRKIHINMIIELQVCRFREIIELKISNNR